MKIKQFDQELHDKNDPPARKAVALWLKDKWGFEVRDNIDKYGTDLMLYRDGAHVGYAEVEVRQSYKKPCPYLTIHVPVRKEHMLKEPNTLFFALTSDMKNAYWIKGTEVLSFPLWEMKDHTKHEFYYDVPTELFKYVDLTERKA